jgi:hypothetical protein
MHPVELIQTQGAVDFAFLVTDEGFAGPESTDRGIIFRRGELGVEVEFSDYCGRDLYVVTELMVYDAETGRPRRWSELEKAYVTHGLGPPQDVPGTAQTLHAAKKSLGRQAEALRRLIAFLKQQQGGGGAPASPPPQASAPARPASWFQS